MPRRDPQKAIQVLDTMLEFFDGGRRWTRGMVLDASGQHRCLIGALEHIRGEFQFGGDGTLDFLHRALQTIPFGSGAAARPGTVRTPSRSVAHALPTQAAPIAERR